MTEKKARDEPQSVNKSSEEKDDEELSEISEELNYEDDEDEENASNSDDESQGDDEQVEKLGDISMADVDQPDTEIAEEKEPRRERKRKRKDDNEDLEAKYLAELTKDDPKEPRGKRQKADADTKADTDADDAEEEQGDEAQPTHESLSKESKDGDLDIEKANRTVFLSNVSIDTISSKSAKRTLITHLSSALDPNDTPAQKFESIRFRSVAFSTGAMPKRAAYITKSLMGATTKSANAYAVFSTPAAARLVAAKMNGTVVLGRHIRVDSVAHPSPTDHRRCVFVGNLGFVDDETVINTNADGETVEKKRTKVPADAEEGLWQTFSKAGKVENVRVVRDPKTRVGKGFAYVQFYVSLSQQQTSLPTFFFCFSLKSYWKRGTCAHSELGHQRCRSCPPPQWQEVPPSPPSHPPCRPRQRPPQNGPRPRTDPFQSPSRRPPSPQHKIHSQKDSRGTSRRRARKETPRPRGRFPPRQEWRQ